MLFEIMDSTMAFLLSLPLLFLYCKNINEGNSIWRWLFPIWYFNLFVMQYMVSFGDIFWVVIVWQLLFIWPISIALYIYLYKQDGKPHFYIGLKKKYVIGLGSLTILSIIVLVICMYDANKKVITFHQQVMEDFSAAHDPNLYLIKQTVTPSTLIGLSEQINEVKKGKVRAATYPWKSRVFVVIGNEQKKMIKEFTYVRFYDSWKLDGVYSESFDEY